MKFQKKATLFVCLLVVFLLAASFVRFPSLREFVLLLGQDAHASGLHEGADEDLNDILPEPTPVPTRPPAETGPLPPLDSMPVFLQNQPPWNTLKINPEYSRSNTYAGAGCGYAAWAMVLSWYTQTTITPYDLANLEVPGKGLIYRTYSGSGIPQYDVTADINELFGLNAKVYKTGHYELIKQELDKGLPVMASTSNSQWAADAHVVVFLRWADREKETVIVHDPNARNNWLRYQRKHANAGNESKANAFANMRAYMRNNGEGWPLSGFMPWGATVVTLGLR